MYKKVYENIIGFVVKFDYAISYKKGHTVLLCTVFPPFLHIHNFLVHNLILLFDIERQEILDTDQVFCHSGT